MGWFDFFRRLTSGPWRWAAGGAALIAFYDAFSSQLDWPSLSKLSPWSAGDITWWGWLLIVQALILLAVLDYVRKLPLTPAEAPISTPDDFDGPEPYPDFKFEAVVGRVNATLSAKRGGSEVQLSEIALEILDKGKLHNLHVWGRSGQSALARINEHEWEKANIDWDAPGLRIPGSMSTYQIGDLHFWSSEINYVWPADY